MLVGRSGTFLTSRGNVTPEEALELMDKYQFEYKTTKLGNGYITVHSKADWECIYVGTGPSVHTRAYLDHIAADAGVDKLQFKLALSKAVGPEGWKL